jgi:hypothetical protein
MSNIFFRNLPGLVGIDRVITNYSLRPAALVLQTRAGYLFLKESRVKQSISVVEA